MTIALLLILLCFAILDIRTRLIPNIVILPAILVGIYLTGYWQSTLSMFLLTALLYSKNKFGGGDVKLFTMLSAFVGWISFPILGLTFGLMKSFRFFRDYRLALPVAPFILVATIGITSLLAYAKILAP